jgi:hypothetical protein
MPRRASRLTLTVTAVRVEQLQDITEADAVAEGVQAVAGEGARGRTAVEGFWMLWESLHGLGEVDRNPWIVALTFTVERRNIDAP